MSDDMNDGIIDKYFVIRNDDEAGKHNDCFFFVLDIEHDPIAREALRTYAGEACEAGYVKLAHELWARIDLATASGAGGADVQQPASA